MIDFPASPTTGQLFTTGALTYRFDGNAWLGTPPGGVMTIPDAPNDGVQYGRQSQAWTPVAGGGGGVWIGDTAPADKVKYPFWWSSASLQLSIWYNDGNTSQWVDTNAEPDTLQGTSTFLLADGTVAAPGLAWASEPGLGWYRNGAGTVSMASQGLEVIRTDASAATGTFISIGVRAAGMAQIALTGQPFSSLNPNWLFLSTADSGHSIGETIAGTATSKPLTMSFPGGLTLTSQFIRIGEYLGSGGQSTDIIICPAAGVTGAPAWPNTGGGMMTARGNTHPSYGAGAVTAYSGSGNTGSTLYDGSQAWSTNSDDRLKDIDSDITDGLEAVLAMRSIRFRLKTDEADYPMRVGLSAQSVQLHVPEAVTEAPIPEGPEQTLSVEKYLSVRYTEVIPHIVSAIKTIDARLKAAGL